MLHPNECLNRFQQRQIHNDVCDDVVVMVIERVIGVLKMMMRW